MRLVALLAGLLASSLALAAPDEEVLGKWRGYPVCSIYNQQFVQACLVGALSHFDQLSPTRVVAHGATRELKRAAKEPEIVWKDRDKQPNTVESFLARNRNTGLLILQGDTILVERYQYERKAEDRFQSFSMAKTVVAMLMGIAIQDGLIQSIDDTAAQYVPELKGHPYGETKLRHLLTMSSGVKFSEEYNGRDDISILSAKTFGQQGRGGAESLATFTQRVAPAGTKFYYASAETEVLGLVLRAVVKQPLAGYLSEKIWKPMGAEDDATWAIDAGGYELGYMGINARLRDWGRFGMLLANYGALDGKQIIPAQWVKAATTAEAPHLQVGTASKFNGYGYQTWLVHPREPYFAALGVRGQAILVDPKSKVVVVHTSVFADARASRSDQFLMFFDIVNYLRQNPQL
jgi:CubicO group peptidase (beta-lactamase class C family)